VADRLDGQDRRKRRLGGDAGSYLKKTLNMSVKDEVTVFLLLGVSFIPVTFSIYEEVIHVTSKKYINEN
jgi:hypothetical protein